MKESLKVNSREVIKKERDFEENINLGIFLNIDFEASILGKTNQQKSTFDPMVSDLSNLSDEIIQHLLLAKANQNMHFSIELSGKRLVEVKAVNGGGYWDIKLTSNSVDLHNKLKSKKKQLSHRLRQQLGSKVSIYV